MDMALGVFRSDSWQVTEIETTGYVDVVFIREYWSVEVEDGQRKVLNKNEFLKTHTCSSEEGKERFGTKPDQVT